MWLWDFRLYLLVIISQCLLLTNGDGVTDRRVHVRHHHYQRLRQRVPFHQRICERYPRHTTAQRTPGDNGFRVRVLGVPSPDGYIPGEVYTGEISSQNNKSPPTPWPFSLKLHIPFYQIFNIQSNRQYTVSMSI